METSNETKCSENQLKDITLREDDDVDSIAGKIIANLNEPNSDLIYKIVATLGITKSLGFYNKTKEIESNGGLYILDGSRRKTPGGVFFFIVNCDESIPRAVRKVLFTDVAQESKRKQKEEARERRRRHNDELRKLLIQEGLMSVSPK